MSDEASAVLALKNAWNGALAAADRLRELAPLVEAVADETAASQLDLETWHRASLAHAIAAEALRGLIEKLQSRPA